MNAKKARALIAIGATSTDLDTGLRDARKKLRLFDKESRSLLSGAKGLAGAGLQGLSTGFGILGAQGLVESAQGVRDFERGLIRLQIATDGNAKSTAQMRSIINQASNDNAIAREEVLAGASAYIALTGDAEHAAQATSAFADIAAATGSSVEDIAKASASLKTSLKIDPADFKPAFSALIVEGKQGAVEVKDLASNLAELAPRFRQFKGGTGVAGLRELGAGFQVVMTGAGSAGEAATQFGDLIDDLSTPATIKGLAKIKINVFDKDPKTGAGVKTMRNAADIIHDIAKSSALADPEKISTIFGRKGSEQAVRSLRQHLDLFDDLLAKSNDATAVDRDRATFLESDAGKIDKAMNGLKLTIAGVFTPERIKEFGEALAGAVDLASKLVKMLEQVAKWIDEHSGASNDNIVSDVVARGQAMTPEARKGYVNDLRTAGMMKAGAHEEANRGFLSIFAGSGAASLPQADQVGEYARKFVGGSFAGEGAPEMTGAPELQAAAILSRSGGYEDRLAKKIGAELHRSPMVVKMDSATVAKKVDGVRRPQPR